MADMVSDVFLSFFCCCCYSPGGHRGAGRSSSRPPVPLQTVELKVRMCCEGCERIVRNALANLRGVDSVEVDVAMEKVRVTGYVDRGRVLREVRRSGKKAEFWPSGGTPRRFTSEKEYFRDGEAYRGSYNYHRHGYGDGDRHGRMREPARGADRPRQQHVQPPPAPSCSRLVVSLAHAVSEWLYHVVELV